MRFLGSAGLLPGKGSGLASTIRPGLAGNVPAATLIADGDLVMAQGDMTMTDEDREVVPYSYCDIYRFRGDKIAELKSYVIKTDAATVA